MYRISTARDLILAKTHMDSAAENTEAVSDVERGGVEVRYAGAPMSRPGLFSVGSLAGIHVLLIDDDPVSRAELSAILRYC